MSAGLIVTDSGILVSNDGLRVAADNDPCPAECDPANCAEVVSPCDTCEETPKSLEVVLAGVTSRPAGWYAISTDIVGGGAAQCENLYWAGLDINGTYTVAQVGACSYACCIVGTIALNPDLAAPSTQLTPNPDDGWGIQIVVSKLATSLAWQVGIYLSKCGIAGIACDGFPNTNHALNIFRGITAAGTPPVCIGDPLEAANEFVEASFPVQLSSGSIAYGGTATVTGSSALGPVCGTLPEPTCLGAACSDMFCLEIWFWDGSTLTRLRWLVIRTGPNTWAAAFPQGEPANSVGAVISCNADEDDPKWLITLTDANVSPTLGVTIFEGDATVCPDAVGLWELQSGTVAFDNATVKNLVAVAEESECVSIPEVEDDCEPCYADGDAFTFVWTYIPSPDNPTDGGCIAMNANGLGGTLAGGYDLANHRFEATAGTPGVTGYQRVRIEKTGNIGAACKFRVELFIVGPETSPGSGIYYTATLSEDVYGDAYGGASSLLPDGLCNDLSVPTPILQKWNVRFDLSPTNCRDEMDACISGAPDDTGHCPA